MLNLISHIKNEARLLPFWIKHHIDMFDTVTIIDYASTDGSLDIIRSLAPHWRIVRSQNLNFDANDVDFEVMQIESYLSGWKIALNTTEFLLCPNIRELIKKAEQEGIYGLTGEAFVMVDKDRLGFDGLDPHRRLVDSLRYGFDSLDINLVRSRLLHRWKTGAYSTGRHNWFRQPVFRTDELVFAWMSYAPWDEAMLNRKMAIGREVPASDVAVGFGKNHLRASSQLETDFADACVRALDLSQMKEWQRLISESSELPEQIEWKRNHIAKFNPLLRLPLFGNALSSEVSGIYDDLWSGPKARFVIVPKAPVNRIIVRAWVPEALVELPDDTVISVNGTVLKQVRIDPHLTEFSIDTEFSAHESLEFRITSNRTMPDNPNDDRELSFILATIELSH
ncbi:glycosyltransferase family 2 protein [Asticcacaulis sp. YBE204]|uniref:glycosyltransferase family 2 protein n=1 Tax=Asticcacaulis sp. YBE204 TaxID=1282363 RepID=UPI0003C3E313|nr:glycosyltransferase family 2 protein [Asticcacaulis sp. YBE204]ESQ80780.1 hypothetical protein AEYBE204_00225 [Asticcacaulis sp. YBE204]